MEIIDTHTHLFMPHFENDLEQVIERAKQNNVIKTFNPNVDLPSLEKLLNLEAKFPDFCLPLIGLHPNSVKKGFEKDLYVLEDWISKHKFYGIGEIGLDFYRSRETYDLQIEAFRIQLNWAKKYKLPAIIHTRKSFNETFNLVRDMIDNDLKGIFHCFTGNSFEAEKIINFKTFKLGIGGVVTFKNSKLPQTLKDIDLQYIVLETDAPFLTPHPYRGQRNETAYVKLVARKLAEIYGKTTEDIAKITTANAKQIFNI